MTKWSTQSIDLHAHAFVASADALARGEPGFASEFASQARFQGEASLRHNAQLWVTRYARALTDVAQRLATMDAMGIDMQAVSLSPTQYYYWAERTLAERIVRAANEGLAELCAKHPDRLVGLATVSLQHPELAADQLSHAVRTLGLRGVQISTRTPDMELSDPRMSPFWRRAAELGAVVFIHPLGCTLAERLNTHYLSNVVGQPVETTVALSHLIFGGVLDRFPGLRVCAAHGGGYLPHYVGRSDHAFAVRPECKELRMPPSHYLHSLYYDSLVYDPRTLGALIERVGSSQVVLGTDFPFDMSEADPLGKLASVGGLDSRDLAKIRGENAARLLSLGAGK